MRQLKTHNDVGGTLQRGIKAVGEYQHWLSAGTALGLYRDGDFIPEDTDIDVEVLLPFDTIVELEEIEGFVPLKFETYKGRPMQRAFVDRSNDVIFDIYFFYTGVEEKAVNWNDHGQMKIDPAFFENAQPLETKYGTFPFPHPIEDYLEVRYGKDWRTPSNKKGLYTNEF